MTIKLTFDAGTELGRFMSAVAADQVEEIDAMMSHAPLLVSAADEQGVTALHVAAAEGKPRAARRLLARGAPLEVTDRVHGTTPLGWAAYFGHLTVIEELLSAGADTSFANSYGLSPAQIAEGGARGEHAADAPQRTREEFAAIAEFFERRARVPR